jgi:hypothetical protein
MKNCGPEPVLRRFGGLRVGRHVRDVLMGVEILREAWNLGWRVRVRCAWRKRNGMKSIRACICRAELDMETLVCTRGRDFPLSWLQERLRCPSCGRRMFKPSTNRMAARSCSCVRFLWARAFSPKSADGPR